MGLQSKGEQQEKGRTLGSCRRGKEKQDEGVMLKEGTAMWHGVDKKYGLNENVRVG